MVNTLTMMRRCAKIAKHAASHSATKTTEHFLKTLSHKLAQMMVQSIQKQYQRKLKDGGDPRSIATLPYAPCVLVC